MISLEKARTKAQNKTHWYKGMLRTGWYLPAFNSPILTWDFLK